MSLEKNGEESVFPAGFAFWTPTAERSVAVGPEQQEIPLPQIPLPLHPAALAEGEPSDQAIGEGIYDYLRQFPDCRHNRAYAELLQEAYPYYVAELGAQAVMLDHKEVDAPYVRRKITCMKILALLQPDNPGLLLQLGAAFYDLAMTFSEIGQCRRHLLAAMGYFQRSLARHADNPVCLNYLAQIDQILGDVPSALRRLGGVAALLEGAAQLEVRQRIAQLETAELPEAPLVDALEAIGEAMELYGGGHVEEARVVMERLEESSAIPAECPTPEFYYLLGMCRGKAGDTGGAFEAFEQALQLNPEFAPALEGKECILEGRSL